MARAATSPPPVTTAPLGRREQKKAETRAALNDAARRLVTAHGYDDVSVQQICDEAGAAHRTFYRYFESKDDCLLADFRDFIDAVNELVEARPSTEHPMDSLLVVVDQIGDAMYALFGTGLDARFAEGIQLVDTVPAVAGRQHWLALKGQDHLTDVFAQRLGVPPTDPEPRWYAAAGTAAYHTATATWMRLPKRQQRMSVLWDLARGALEAFSAGLNR